MFMLDLNLIDTDKEVYKDPSQSKGRIYHLAISSSFMKYLIVTNISMNKILKLNVQNIKPQSFTNYNSPTQQSAKTFKIS